MLGFTRIRINLIDKSWFVFLFFRRLIVACSFRLRVLPELHLLRMLLCSGGQFLRFLGNLPILLFAGVVCAEPRHPAFPDRVPEERRTGRKHT